MISIFIESENTDAEILNHLKKLVDAIICIEHNKEGEVIAKVTKMNYSDIEFEKKYDWENKF